MRGRGVANDRGKGPEIGNEGDVHCLQKGLILSQAKCLVPNKDLFWHFGPLVRSLLVSLPTSHSVLLWSNMALSVALLMFFSCAIFRTFNLLL